MHSDRYPYDRHEHTDRHDQSLSPTTRKLLLAVLAVALVVAVVVTSVALVAALRGGPSGTPSGGSSRSAGSSGTPNAQASATSGPDATATTSSGNPTPSPTNAAFVCANAGGSTSTYVFVNADHQLYRVTGCATPVQLTHLDAASRILPLAFSPSSRWLMVSIGPAQQADSGGPPTCQQLMNPQTGSLTKTRFCEDMSLSPGYPIDRLIAWTDDNTFLEAEYPDKAGSIKVLRVNASTLASSLITTFTWVAGAMTPDSSSGIRLRGDDLYYGGYRDASEGAGYLHRYSLSTATDTSLVKLGVATSGPCQVYDGPCNWTGPWDITRDGSRIVYHDPTPTIGPSDTTNPAETPLYVARPDGTGALQITNPPNTSGQYMSVPIIAPSGGWVAGTGGNRPVLVPTDGSMAAVQLPTDYQFAAWRSDTVALLTTSGPDYTLQYALYTLASKQITKLSVGTHDYVWGA